MTLMMCFKLNQAKKRNCLLRQQNHTKDQGLIRPSFIHRRINAIQIQTTTSITWNINNIRFMIIYRISFNTGNLL